LQTWAGCPGHVLVVPSGGAGFIFLAVDEEVSEGVEGVVVGAVFDGEFAAFGGVVVALEGADEVGAAGVDVEFG
jgi:hypothetical protein